MTLEDLSSAMAIADGPKIIFVALSSWHESTMSERSTCSDTSLCHILLSGHAPKDIGDGEVSMSWFQFWARDKKFSYNRL